MARTSTADASISPLLADGRLTVMRVLQGAVGPGAAGQSTGTSPVDREPTMHRQVIDDLQQAEVAMWDRQQVERLKRGAIFANIETEYVKQDGSRFPVSLTLSPMRGPDGTISGYTVVEPR